MLLGVKLIVKVNWKRKTYSLHCHFFKKSEFDRNGYLAHILLFFKKMLLQRSSIHMLTKLAFCEEQSFVLF